MTFLWLPIPHATLGDVHHIATDRSRRRAVVVAYKPGFALLLWHH